MKNALQSYPILVSSPFIVSSSFCYEHWLEIIMLEHWLEVVRDEGLLGFG